jgi:peptide deformylase
MRKRRNRVTAQLVIAPNDILTKVCEPVADGEDVSAIIRDMMHILINSKTGVGLAAPQAGYLKRIIVFKDRGGFRVFVNPVIETRSFKSLLKREYCLSYPGESAKIVRALEVNVSSMNYAGDLYYGGKRARIIQHEIDHLDGKCKVGAV